MSRSALSLSFVDPEIPVFRETLQIETESPRRSMPMTMFSCVFSLQFALSRSSSSLLCQGRRPVVRTSPPCVLCIAGPSIGPSRGAGSNGGCSWLDRHGAHAPPTNHSPLPVRLRFPKVAWAFPARARWRAPSTIAKHASQRHSEWR